MLLSHPPKFIKRIFPSLIWRIETKKQELFLTFDDGPTPGVTDVVLDKLKAANVNATFFCLGKNIIEHPTLFQRILDEGHSVGNHTFHHKNGWKSPTFDFLNDVKLFNNVYQTNLFRPPYGRLKGAQIKALNSQYKIIMWSILSMDYDSMISKEKCLELATKKWKKGSIIVFHDSIKAEKNMLYALDGVLKKTLDESWQCLRIT